MASTSCLGIRNIRSQDYSFPGPFIPWNFRSKYPGPYLPRIIRSFVSRAVPGALKKEQRNKQKRTYDSDRAQLLYTNSRPKV